MKMLMENWNQFVNEEMSQEDEEMSLADLIDQLKDEQIASAVKNWAKGGKHTMDDLHTHLEKKMQDLGGEPETRNLDKKMQDLGGKPETRGGSIMGLYAPDVFEEGEELDEKIEKTKGGKYYATSKSGRRLSKEPKTKKAALDQLAAVKANQA